ncbi:MAG: sulfotransferase family protein [Myxococcota bacterium]
MTLGVLGAGFGRTGTLSLKLALERLGFGPCYHMLEVMAHPEHSPLWSAAGDGEPVDWDTLFEGYRAAVDWPACRFWRELAQAFPAARIVLSVREPERWYESARATIFQAMQLPLPPEAPEWVRAQRDMARKLVLEQTFGGRFEDRDHAIAVYQQHNRDVERAFSPDRLLVHEPAQGWQPLCEFLDTPVPDAPYPRVNSTEEFQSRLAAASS